MNNGIGKVKERELTPEVVASLHSHEVMAVLFAEVGAQGRPEYASVMSRTKEGVVFVDSGSFSFDHNGKEYGSGIEIELLERLVPFLKCMRGDSLETTIRGFGWSQDCEWYHFDACFGNHLIVRKVIAKDVADQFSRAQFAVYNEGIDAVLRVLGVERPTGEKDTGTLSEDKNGQDNGMAKSNLAGIACCSSFNYIKGSIFRANEYGADGVVVYVPCGLAAMRAEWDSFKRKLGEPDEQTGECAVFCNRGGWKVVIGFENIQNRIYSEDEMQAMVVSSLQLLQRKGARHVAMNGIRIDMTGRRRETERPEEMLVKCVTDWCLKHPSAFESVSFVDLRGGFNACDKDGAYERSMLDERSVQTNDCCTKHANAQTAKEGVAASQGQDDNDAQFLLRVLLWIVGVVTVGALIAAVVL